MFVARLVTISAANLYIILDVELWFSDSIYVVDKCVHNQLAIA